MYSKLHFDPKSFLVPLSLLDDFHLPDVTLYSGLAAYVCFNS